MRRVAERGEVGLGVLEALRELLQQLPAAVQQQREQRGRLRQRRVLGARVLRVAGPGQPEPARMMTV